MANAYTKLNLGIESVEYLVPLVALLLRISVSKNILICMDLITAGCAWN